MDTYFAPAQRTERRKFTNQVETISRNPIMDALLKAAAGILVVLNEDRQIVALNHAFLKEIGVKDAEKVLGMRLGESLHCVHAFEKPNGCGTTESCLSCGAAVAMMAAITDDKTQEQVCALLSDKNGTLSNTCLLIKAQPIQLEDNRWILIYAQDVTQQQFWINLERIFFHDINNVLTSLYGNVQLLEMNLPENDEVGSLKTGIERIIREVEMQKTFSLHKQEGINIICKKVSLGEILQELRLIFTGHRSSFGKHIREDRPEQEIILHTDPILVSRILGNMVINAFESSDRNETIHLKALVTEDHICFEVRNACYIPPKIQKRIFQRHFSTKPGEGRGMGTYSMKLFGEKYLHGKVSFISSQAEGTVFTFELPR
jgi:signal transduction histidine kinase